MAPWRWAIVHILSFTVVFYACLALVDAENITEVPGGQFSPGKDRILFLRIQSAGNALLTDLLRRLGAESQWPKLAPKSPCRSPFFGSSDVPTASQIVAAGAGALECDWDWSTLRRRHQGLFSNELWEYMKARIPDKVYSGNLLSLIRVPRACAAFDSVERVLPHMNHCGVTVDHHFHLIDLLRVALGSENTGRSHLVTLLRHPEQRVAVEFDHVRDSLSTRSWDYCFGNALQRSFQDVRDEKKQLRDAFKEFLSDENNSLGTSNRQTKMLTGLTVAVDSSLSVQNARLWEATALDIAKRIVDETPLVLVADMLPESLAVFMYYFDYLPILDSNIKMLGEEELLLEKQAMWMTKSGIRGSLKMSDITWEALWTVATEMAGPTEPTRDILAPNFLDEDSSREVRRLNKIDMELYDYARERLRQRFEWVRKQMSMNDVTR